MLLELPRANLILRRGNEAPAVIQFAVRATDAVRAVSRSSMRHRARPSDRRENTSKGLLSVCLVEMWKAYAKDDIAWPPEFAKGEMDVELLWRHRAWAITQGGRTCFEAPTRLS